MKKIMLIVVIFSLFSCKKEPYINQQLRKNLEKTLLEYSGDTIKIKDLGILKIDSVSEYRDLLAKIELTRKSEALCIDSVKALNRTYVPILYRIKQELDTMTSNLAQQHDTFRTATYHVKYWVSYTYRNESKIDTSMMEFDKSLKVK